MLPLVGWALAASAATFDPQLDWRTITTEHFHIHFHQGEEALAETYTGLVEEVFDELVGELRWQPKQRIHVTLVDRTDSANGYASTIPYNAITLFVTAPTPDGSLNLYEDWNRALFTHELTHILHIDTNHGIVRLARNVLGRVASTHQASPAWMIEGFATLQETRQTPGGRGRAPIAEMVRRTAALEDDFPPLGNLDGFQPDPPAGNLRYLFGQDFMQWVADHQGEDVWTRWTHLYGGHVPFLLPTRKALGRSLSSMYKDWRADALAEAERIRADVAAQGETLSRTVSDPEASCIAPAFSPDGESLVFSCYDLRRGSQIWLADGDGSAPRIELEKRGATAFTWRADSKAFVYAGIHVVNQYNTWSDIYLHDLGSPTSSSVTNGARARDPEFSPDGSRLLVVTQRAQNTQLEALTVDRRRQALTDHTANEQVAGPRYSPDGKRVALSLWKDGARDLWLFDPDGQPLRRLTADVAVDADPAWSLDGQWLYFSSDRSGIPNVYAIELATDRLWQVTNVVTGALKPAPHPNGTRLAWQQYSADGWEVRVADVDRNAWIDRGTLPRLPSGGDPYVPGPPAPMVASVDGWTGDPLPRARRGSTFTPAMAQAPSEGIDTFEDSRVEDAFGAEKDYPFTIEPHRYRPAPWLLPRYVLPWFVTTPHAPDPSWSGTCIEPTLLCSGILANLGTSAVDPLQHWAWGANVHYRTDAAEGGAAVALTYNRYLPVVSVGASTSPVAAAQFIFEDPTLTTEEGGPLLTVTDPPSIYWERRNIGWAQVAFPYRLRSSLFGQYSLTERRESDPIPPDAVEEAIPLRGTIGALSAGWRRADVQPTAYAISAEDGEAANLVVSVLSPWLGTAVVNEDGDKEPLTQLQITGEIREYVTNPWVPNHVFAWRAASGIAIGGTQYLGSYQLGGAYGDGAFTATPDEFRMLRGYPFAFDSGDLYWLGSAEYRFPLWRIERGVGGTTPLYLRNLSAAAFFDTGNAFVLSDLEGGLSVDGRDILNAATEQPLASVGAELTFRTVVLWGAGVSARGGVAVPLTVIAPTAVPYLQFGGSF